MGRVGVVTNNRAQDQARTVGRAQPVPAAQEQRAEPRPQTVAPSASSTRRWSVRVHWGIVFAVVASLILWLAIKTIVGLAL